MSIQGKVFEKLFSTAEIAKLSPKERAEYEATIKVYRDYKNTIDSSYEEGKAEGKAEAARGMFAIGMDISLIAKVLNLSEQFVLKALRAEG